MIKIKFKTYTAIPIKIQALKFDRREALKKARANMDEQTICCESDVDGYITINGLHIKWHFSCDNHGRSGYADECIHFQIKSYSQYIDLADNDHIIKTPTGKIKVYDKETFKSLYER